MALEIAEMCRGRHEEHERVLQQRRANTARGAEEDESDDAPALRFLGDQLRSLSINSKVNLPVLFSSHNTVEFLQTLTVNASRAWHAALNVFSMR